MSDHRIEKDMLGEVEIPQDAYWGVHTLRAIHNFPITGMSISMYPRLIEGLAMVKKAAALANQDLGILDEMRCRAVGEACDELVAGKLHDQFPVDVIQGGAGTSTNMNANEVIANRALEILGREKGDYAHLHPLNHVNMSQSTNDVYPTAVRVAVLLRIHSLSEAMVELQEALEAKSFEFDDVLKLGRTQLQDAVPMTLGQEFLAFSVMVGEDVARLNEAQTLLHEVNLGATAVGTGINTDVNYARRAIGHLRKVSGVPVTLAPNLVEATQDAGAFVQLSGVLKRIAVKLSKICNDLRLLSSGPRAGFGEINLPARAAGSSIMPGKVNPIIPEVVNQIAFEAIGNDITVTMAAEAGQLQLNAFEPVICHSIFKTVRHLESGCRTLTVNCIRDITANRELLQRRVETAPGLATALNPVIGYENATRVAKEALASGRTVREIVLEFGLMSEAQLDEVLQPAYLTAPRKMK